MRIRTNAIRILGANIHLFAYTGVYKVIYTGTHYHLLISVSVAPIDTPNRYRGGGSFYFPPETEGWWIAITSKVLIFSGLKILVGACRCVYMSDHIGLVKRAPNLNMQSQLGTCFTGNRK
jgi:hypothetical protein